MRLIDADALFKCETCHHRHYGKCTTFCDSVESYRPDMSKLEIIEAEPVRHGHWIEKATEYYKEWIKAFGNDRFFAECEYFTDHIACSNCLEKYNYIDNDSANEWNYCPNCGAKMDGKENEHEF